MPRRNSRKRKESNKFSLKQREESAKYPDDDPFSWNGEFSRISQANIRIMRIRGCGDGEVEDVEEASTFALGALFSYLRRKIAVVKNVHVSGEENFSESLYKGNIHCVNNSAVTLHFNNTRKDFQNWKIAPLNSIAGAGWAETPKSPRASPSF